MLIRVKSAIAAQFRHAKLGERATILCGEIGQVVRELIEPIDARTCVREGLCQQQCGSHDSLSFGFSFWGYGIYVFQVLPS